MAIPGFVPILSEPPARRSGDLPDLANGRRNEPDHLRRSRRTNPGPARSGRTERTQASSSGTNAPPAHTSSGTNPREESHPSAKRTRRARCSPRETNPSDPMAERPPTPRCGIPTCPGFIEPDPIQASIPHHKCAGADSRTGIGDLTNDRGSLNGSNILSGESLHVASIDEITLSHRVIGVTPLSCGPVWVVVDLGASGRVGTAHHPDSIEVGSAHPTKTSHVAICKVGLSTKCVTPK
jgi:hypothetical protein